jgi:light-regulated signal transduction histidine kinase (bacteriophytochrome)
VRRLNEGLERRVEERTAQLEGAIREMASFSYTIAHDLRAPLRAMSGFAQAMVDDYGSGMDPTCLDFARRVAASARKMDALIVDLLSYSRLIHLDVPLEPVNLESLVRTVIYRMGSELSACGAKVDVEWPLPKVQGNRRHAGPRAVEPHLQRDQVRRSGSVAARDDPLGASNAGSASGSRTTASASLPSSTSASSASSSG